MDPDHPFDTLLGGMVECGHQLVDTIDKVGDILGDLRLVDRALHAGSQRQLPVLLQGLQLALLSVAAGGVLQLRTEDGGGHIIDQLLIVFIQRDRRQQPVALHA